MKRINATIVLCAAILFLAANVAAGPYGYIGTDRFGYTGTVKRYGTLSDARSGANQVGEDIAIGNRDLALSIGNGYWGIYENIIMGSWWYSTEGQAGWGNTRGNSGLGFVQLYDFDGSTDTQIDMAFDDFDGTYWTEFQLLVEGMNADYSNDWARFWVDYQGSDADVVLYHEYRLELTAGGLEGVFYENTGFVEAYNHPGSVTGRYSGIFENVSADYTQNNGFYVFDLQLDMINWAWENSDDLDPYAFYDSIFAAKPVPEPATVVLMGVAIIGFLGARRRRRSVL